MRACAAAILAALVLTAVLTLSAAELARADAPCAPTYADGRLVGCAPALTALPATPDWLRVALLGERVRVRAAFTDLHVYDARGRAYSARYASRRGVPILYVRRGYVAARYYRETRTFVVSGARVLLAGWRG